MDKPENQNNSLPPKQSASKVRRDLADMSPSMRAIVNANKQKAASDETTEIPKFNLAENIMAEHRRVTATKRKSPLQKIPPQQTEDAQEKEFAIGFPETLSLDNNKIIREIVARDIKKLCGNFA